MRILKISLSIIFSLSSISAAAANLCQSEFSALTKNLEGFSGDQEEKKSLLAEYHSKRQMLPELCSAQQRNRVEAAATKVFGARGSNEMSSTLDYVPRKTVEIGTVDSYANIKQK